MTKLLPLMLTITLAACSDEPGPPEPMFELAEITLYEDGTPMVKLHADGTSEVGDRGKPEVTYRPGPSLRADGTILRGEREVARLAGNGDIVDIVEHRPMPRVKVTAAGVTLIASAGPAKLSLRPDGTLIQTGGNQVFGKVRIEGADTAAKRRAILALIAVHLAPPQTR